MSFVEDNMDLFLADFGVIALGGTCTVNGVSTEGIFDKNYFEQSFGIDGNKPVLRVPTVNIPVGTMRGTAVAVNSINYTIADKQPDGTGMTVLILEKA